MKGTEVSEESLASAREFLKLVSGVEWPMDNQELRMSRAKLIRLIAWYGELKKQGDGSGKWISKRNEETDNRTPGETVADREESRKEDGGKE